ncbi:MAG: CDP-alcohol phosphatidyltransferase family protein [Nitrospirae bacterium]|nr:MAG: CDP-alcohol phosphatidyltransferase family protein [Nitrospirota bacterium]
MFGAKLGHILDKPLEPFAKKIQLSPNTITLAGFVLSALAAAAILFDAHAGGLLILFSGFFDMLDGVVARVNRKNTAFGAFLDSTLDRYSDSFFFMAIAWLFYGQNDIAGSLLSLGGLAGALLTSYVRARAEGLGIQCKVGLMERPERLVLLALGCITGFIFPVIAALFVLTHLTVIQRIMHVYRVSRMQ